MLRSSDSARRAYARDEDDDASENSEEFAARAKLAGPGAALGMDAERRALVAAATAALQGWARALSTQASPPGALTARQAGALVQHDEWRETCTQHPRVDGLVRIMALVHRTLALKSDRLLGTAWAQTLGAAAARPPWPGTVTGAQCAPLSWARLVPAVEVSLGVQVAGALLLGDGLALVVAEWLTEDAPAGVSLLWTVTAPVVAALFGDKAGPRSVSALTVPEAAKALAGWHYLSWTLVDYALVLDMGRGAAIGES